VGNKLKEHAVPGDAVPWLLLDAKSHEGKGVLSDVTYIQRLNTTGGKAPRGRGGQGGGGGAGGVHGGLCVLRAGGGAGAEGEVGRGPDRSATGLPVLHRQTRDAGEFG